MTEKRFYVAKSNLIDGYCVFDRKKKYAFSPRPRKADCLNDARILNELHEENQELRMDNDIKFWKHECIRETNTNSIFTFELGKAIDEGYIVSEKFRQMMEEWKKETEKMKEKHKRLFE